MGYASRIGVAGLTLGAALGLSAAAATADDVTLPQTLVWTAYDIGSTGYSQAVGIGAAFKNRLNVSLRVLPGKNDVSRLVPLRDNRAGYSATGSESSYASEAMYLFGTREWGPQPITQLIMSVSDGTSAMVTTRDSGIETIADLKGRRVAWVKGAASLQNSIRGHLAFGGLTWNDVVMVEVPGYAASVQAAIDGQADAAYGTTNSAPFLRIDASPRGLRFLPPQESAAFQRSGMKLRREALEKNDLPVIQEAWDVTG
ncbi:MAG: TAXI family TRAP transporter solute-binding subunit [Alphaproteobacteria bacterium]